MKNLVKGYDNEYYAPEIIISQTLGDVIMDSDPSVNDGNSEFPPNNVYTPGTQMGQV